MTGGDDSADVPFHGRPELGGKRDSLPPCSRPPLSRLSWACFKSPSVCHPRGMRPRGGLSEGEEEEEEEEEFLS